MNNTRFATSVHILTILAKYPEEWVCSEWIARSININPAMVRKEMRVLQAAGLVTGRKGKDGGSKLQIPRERITLADVYLAVKNTDILGKKNMETSVRCPIGKNINHRLAELFAETDRQVINTLQGKTLATFADQF